MNRSDRSTDPASAPGRDPPLRLATLAAAALLVGTVAVAPVVLAHPAYHSTGVVVPDGVPHRITIDRLFNCNQENPPDCTLPPRFRVQVKTVDLGTVVRDVTFLGEDTMVDIEEEDADFVPYKGWDTDPDVTFTIEGFQDGNTVWGNGTFDGAPFVVFPNHVGLPE